MNAVELLALGMLLVLSWPALVSFIKNFVREK